MISRGDYKETSKLASQLIEVAAKSKRSDRMLIALYSRALTLFFGGEFAESYRLFEDALSWYDCNLNAEYTLEYGSDVGLWGLCYKAMIDDLSGHRDKALMSMNDALAMARSFSNRLHLGAALTTTCMLHNFRRDPITCKKIAEETMSLGRDQSLPQWLTFGCAHAGWALSKLGKCDQGIPLLIEGLEGLRRVSHRFGEPHMLAMLADAYSEAGQKKEALATLDQGLELAVEANHLTFVVELYRQRGCCLASMGDGMHAGSGEKDLLNAIEIARRQVAKTFELRSATSLASLWVKQERKKEAYEMLAPIYNCFTEGFDTPDLMDAKILLGKLH